MVLRVSRGGHENLEITTTARGRRDDALVEGAWIYSVRNNQQAAKKHNKHQTIDNKQLIANKPTTNIKKKHNKQQPSYLYYVFVECPLDVKKIQRTIPTAEPFKTSGTEGG